MYAYVVADTGPEDEGIPSFPAGGMWLPMVGADLKRAEQLKPYAQVVAQQLGKPVRLLRFTTMHEMAVVEPT
jgi:hypothetical protein